jgi:hypothetical protein
MTTKMFLSIAAGLLIATMVAGATPTKTMQDQSPLKGYITVGRNVVVLPERLQQGDRIEFYNTQGDLVFGQNVGNGYVSAPLAGIPKGVYTMVVFRKNMILVTEETPFLGNLER